MPANYETNAQYHADTSHISHSMLEVFRKSPARYHGLYVTKTIPTPPPTPEMVLGSMVHSLLLTPERFTSEFLVAVGCSRRSGPRWQARLKDAKDYWPECRAVLPSDHAIALKLVAAIESSDLAGPLFRGAGRNEDPIRWTDPRTGLLLKCRPDRFVERGDTPPAYLFDEWDLCIEVKTTMEPHQAEFAKEINKWGYHRQAAMYVEGLTAIGYAAKFIFVVVGKSLPHDVCVYEAHELELIQPGREANVHHLAKLAREQETNVWQAPEQRRLQVIRLPGWSPDKCKKF